jgi:hypothetical protein
MKSKMHTEVSNAIFTNNTLLNIDTKLTEILLKEHAETFNDKYQMGIQRFIEEETLDELFQFIALYI